MFKYAGWIISFVLIGALIFVLCRPDPPPKTVTKKVKVIEYKTITKSVPVTKIVYRDPTGQIVTPDIKTSFTAEAPFQSKIVTPNIEIEFSGFHLVKMENDNLSVTDKLDPIIKETLKTKPLPLNEAGICYTSENGLGAYFRRYISFGMITPWVEIRGNLDGRIDLSAGLPVRF